MAIKIKSIIDKGFRKFGYVPSRKPGQRRSYSAGKTSDLLADFMTQVRSPEEDLRDLNRIRTRSRDLCHNNDYAKQAIRLIKNNVVGWAGIDLQMKAFGDNGKLDANDNREIKTAFTKWGKKDTASVDGKLSWADCQHLFIETVVRDGECLVRKVPFLNKFSFSLQFIDMDHLETGHNEDLKNGNKIRMSIEFDKWSRPVAYHVLEKHPSESSAVGQRKLRIPAGEMIHGFIAERPNQPRGVPWMHTAIVRLKMLGGYENSELVASRLGAAKMGFYKKPAGEQYKGDDEDEDGTPVQEVEPGMFETLPEGWDVEPFDPQHPNTAFKDFVKSMLRGAASGIGISYNALASDLEGVNYSSMRSGKLDERDSWRCIQSWMAQNFNQEVFSGGTVNFLTQAMLAGPLKKLPFTKFEKFDAATWKPRGWEWVDPQKEVTAHREELEAGLTSRTRVLSKRGIDFKELLDEIAEEKEMMAAKGVEFVTSQGPNNNPSTDGGQEDAKTD